MGKLIYLNATRPDITFAVDQLSQFMANPTQGHLDGVFRVLKYLKKEPGLGVLLSADSDLHIRAYSDADYAGSTPQEAVYTGELARRSTTGYVTYIGDSPVSWRSKKQHSISLSSAESEYRAMRSRSAKTDKERDV